MSANDSHESILSFEELALAQGSCLLFAPDRRRAKLVKCPISIMSDLFLPFLCRNLVSLTCLAAVCHSIGLEAQVLAHPLLFGFVKVSEAGRTLCLGLIQTDLKGLLQLSDLVALLIHEGQIQCHESQVSIVTREKGEITSQDPGGTDQPIGNGDGSNSHVLIRHQFNDALFPRESDLQLE